MSSMTISCCDSAATLQERGESNFALDSDSAAGILTNHSSDNLGSISVPVFDTELL